jgi:hypothetical protein
MSAPSAHGSLVITARRQQRSNFNCLGLSATYGNHNVKSDGKGIETNSD